MEQLAESGVFWGTLVLLWVGASVAFSIFWWDWLRQGASTPESHGTTIRNAALIGGGGVALLFAFWRSVVAERRSKTEEQQARIAQQGLLNGRYQKGVEMLGSNVLSVRLGGIYELRRLAEEHPKQFHIQVMDTLCAFARHPLQVNDSEAEQADNIDRSLPVDVQELLFAVSKCHGEQLELEANGNFSLYLENADLTRANLTSTNFTSAILTGADLSHSFLSFANLSHAKLSLTKLHKADLSDSRLLFAYMYHTKMSNADLSGADLSGANLVGVDLTGCRLWRTELCGAMFNSVILDFAVLESTDFSKVTFLNKTSFIEANLDYADLSGRMLQDSDFNGASMIRTNISGAILVGAQLANAVLDDANLSGTRFSSHGWYPAQGLTQTQLDQARADPNDPPILTGISDPTTGQVLIWRGKPLTDDA